MLVLGALLIAAVLTVNVVEVYDPLIITDDMTVEERQRFNGNECTFGVDGKPTAKACADWRMINTQRREGIHLTKPSGHYLTPYAGDLATVEIPEDLYVVWHDQVSKVEVACYQILKAVNGVENYPIACYDGRLKMAHVVYGDTPALEHEIRHHIDGRFHE